MMKKWLFGIFVIGASSVWAGPDLGTKSEILNASAAAPGRSDGNSFMQLFQAILALGIVLALLKWVLPKAMARFGKRLTTPLNSTLQIEETAHFGAGTLYIVQARSRTLLLCAAQQGVSCLADLTSQMAASEKDPPAFFELFDQAAQKPSQTLAQAVVKVPEPFAYKQETVEKPAEKSVAKRKTDPRKALERLQRLAG